MTSDNFSSINNLKSMGIEFDYGDLVGISVHDNKNGLSITGDIKDEKENYNDGVDDADNIDNVRFKIEETGLESVYNNAPELNITGNLQEFKDENIDFYKGVNVSDIDPHDTEIGVEDIQIETDLDITKVGSYNATYTIVDSWGRSTSKERNITVKSSLENNKIEYYYNSQEQPVIDISIDNVNRKLNVNKHYSIFKRNIFKASDSDETIFEVGLFDKDANLKEKLTILASDDTASVNNKLEEFNETEFKYGDYISVFAKDHTNGIKIQGNMYKPEEITEDYSKGIQNTDFMNNVRFEITPDELRATYNNAPEMEIPDGVVIEYYIGDDIEISNDIRVRDDLDIDISNRSIIIPESENEKLGTVGQHEINIQVRDSWGRYVQGTRIVDVKDSMDRNEILFGGHIKGQGGIETMFKMKFDTTTKQIKITDQRANALNNEADHNRYYVIKVLDKDGITSKLPNGAQEIVLSTGDSANTSKLNPLKDLAFDYGDYIKIDGYQRFRIKMLGAIRNGVEDYSDGVNMGEAFSNTKFKITKEGLKAEYTNPIQLTDSESLIEYNGNEGKPLKIKINHDTGEVTLPQHSGGFFDYNIGEETAFIINWYKAKTNTKHRFEFLGKRQGATTEFSNFVQNNTFEEGDYLSFETPRLERNNNKKIEISGKLLRPTNQDEILAKEDFSDGIDYQENMTRTEFHYNKDGNKGLTIVKKGAPIINGAEDIDVPQTIQGQRSSFDSLAGVTAIDYDGTTDLTSRIIPSGTVDTGRLGMYEVVYTVTNDDGIETKVYRNVRVYSTATLTLKDNNMPPLEQGSIGSDEESINNYLLSLVHAEDNDDPDISSKIKVESTDLNPEEPGEYNVNYSVTNSYGKKFTLDANVAVARTICVSVPTVAPFQVVTNLIDENAEEFVSGTINVTNNRTSDVKVYLDSFNKQENNNKSNVEEIEIVNPDYVDDWNSLSVEESMKKMALGIYTKEGITGDNLSSKESPIWLETGKTYDSQSIGTLPRAESLTTPLTAKLSLTSKHGKNFKGGTAKSKFNLVLRFE